MLDLTSLEKALTSLERAIERAKKNPQDEEVRDSVIQRFEYSYELSWKMLKPQLEIDSPVPASIDAMDFKSMIRESAQRGFVAIIKGLNIEKSCLFLFFSALNLI